MNKTRTPLGQLMKLMDLVRRQMENDRTGTTGDAAAGETGEPMIAKLMKRGFRLEEIETAMKWLSLMSLTIGSASKPAAPEAAVTGASADPADAARASGVRQLHTSEAIRLTPEAQRHLLSLLDRGEIAPLQFERTIEYLWRHDLREVSVMRLDLILSMNDPQTDQHGTSANPTGPTSSLSPRVNPPLFIN
ncbi:MAG TPA: DUF494 family protein [Candidatus Ozemobacteraceae bacterium]